MPPVIAVSHNNITRYELTPVETDIGSSVKTIVENNITISCRAEGFPSPSITWNHNGATTPLVSGERWKIKGQSLTIVKAQEGDSGVYQCNATNIEGSTSHSSKIDVIGEDN